MIQSFNKLKKYCEQEDFKGWDPYDGLNSTLYQNIFLKKNWYFRLAWIQFFKLNPINLRPYFLVAKDYNPKGLGLFLFSYCTLLEIEKDDSEKKKILKTIHFLADLLISKVSVNYSGACWGYNFDWQNRVFFQPANTPTIVPTSFIANAFFKSYEVTNKSKYLDVALSSLDFIIKDLNRTSNGKRFIFSYSPLDNSRVYNASLLGSRLLSKGYHFTKKEYYLDLAKNSISYVVDNQNPDGSWVYGEAPTQNWIDSFHTGYNLECLYEYSQNTNDNQFSNSFDLGFSYYLNNFFLKDGSPKYYNDSLYPIDIHSPAQFIVTLTKTKKLNENLLLADKVLNWTIKNMQDKEGYFYYQSRKYYKNKISYMRWSNAWMFYAFSNYLKGRYLIENMD